MTLDFDSHPGTFSTYIQQSTFNLTRNIAPIPQHIDSPHGLDEEDRRRLNGGFEALHRFFLDLYQDIHESPEVYNLPLDVIDKDKSRDRVRSLFKAVDGVILMVLGLGITGSLNQDTCELKVDKTKWLQWCRKNGCRKVEDNLETLNRIGLQVSSECDCVVVKYPDTKELTWCHVSDCMN